MTNIQDNLTSKRGRKDLLQYGSKADGRLHLKKQLHRHIDAKGWGPWSAGVSRTHWSGDPAHPQDLKVIWLDLTNAYGSIPHKLVQTTMAKCLVPHHIVDLILDYYNQFKIRVSAGSVTSEWHNVEVGRGPLTLSGTRQPPITAFMDDLRVTIKSVPSCRLILQGLEKL